MRRFHRGPAALSLLVLAAAAGVAALMPAFLSTPDVRELTAAVALAGPAAATSVALAAGRPSLATAGLAGAGAYTAGILTVHGWSSPAALAAGTLAGAGGGVVVAGLGALLDGGAFLALSLLAAVAGGAAVLAAPATTGAEAGLGPLPPLQLPLGGGSAVVLGTAGALHAVLVVAAVAVAACALLLAGGPGPRWRASGGDVDRARATGARPHRSRIEALALGGAAAGACGAVAALAAGVAEPAAFSVDAAVLPLMAALLSGRAGPVPAALAATLTGVAGYLVLPALGYTGPPSAVAMATGGLAAVTAVARVALSRRSPRRRGEPTAAARPRPPVAAPLRGPQALTVAGLDVAAPDRGPTLVTRLRLDVPAGTVQGLAGPNGAGKSTVLTALLRACRRGDPRVRPAGGGVVLLPQAGGGLPGCTVRETLVLAAHAGGLDRDEAARAVTAWLDHLGPAAPPHARCETLGTGARRRLDLARALLLRPSVLLADEPLAGLGDADREAAVACLRAAAAAGVAVLVAEHDLATLGSLASSVTWIDRDGAASAVAGATP